MGGHPKLAERVGCTRQTIIVQWHGRFVLSISLAFRIADEFGCSVEEVFQ